MGFTILALAMLLGAFVFYLGTDAGKSRVRALIVQRAGQRLNGTLEIDSIDYGLSGELALGGVRIKSEQGAELVALDHLRVRPDLRAIIDGKELAIDEVELRGLRLNIEKDAEGGSNLKSLVKPSNAPPSEPRDKLIVVRSIAIDEVDVSVKNADGSTLAVRHALVHGSLAANPAKRNARVVLDSIGVDVAIEKPTGLAVSVLELRTGLDVDLTGGKGKVKLLPLTANVALTPPGGTQRSFPVSLDGIEVEIGDGDVDISLDQLGAGALALASIDVHGKLEGGALAGPPGADVVGLSVDAAKVNALLGKEVLATNIDLTAHVSGPDTALAVGLDVLAGGANVHLAGNLDVAKADDPKFDVKLTARDVDTTRLLAPSLGVAPARVGSLDVDLKGHGRTLAGADATAHVVVKDVSVRGIPIDDVDLSAKVANGKVTLEPLVVRTVEQKLTARGTIDPTTREVDVQLQVTGDVGVALAKLKEAGLPITAKIPKGLVKLPEGDLEVGVKGALAGQLDVTAKASKLTLLGGAARLEAKATVLRGDPLKGEKPVTVQSMDASFSISGLRLSNILHMRGKRLPPGLDAMIDASVRASGTPEEPTVNLDAGATLIRTDGGKRARLGASAKVVPALATVDLKLYDVESPSTVLLRADARVPLTKLEGKPTLDRQGPLEVHLALPSRSIAGITEYLPTSLLFGRVIPEGTLGLSVDLEGSVARPRAKIDLDLVASLLPSGSGAKLPPQRVHLASVLTSEGRASSLDTTLDVHLATSEPAFAHAHVSSAFPYSPLMGGAAAGKHTIALDVAPRDLRTLPDSPKLARLRALGGTLELGLRADVDARDAKASLDASVKGALAEKGPLDLVLGVDLEPERTLVDLDVKNDGSPLARLAGNVGLGGKGLIPRARQGGLDAPLDLDLTVPRRTLVSLGKLVPSLAKAPGDLQGAIHGGGTLEQPLAKGTIDVLGVTMADGSSGGAQLALDVSAARLGLDIGLGAATVAASPLALSIEAPRASVAGLSEGGELPVVVKTRAASVDVARLLPAVLLEKTTLKPVGKLDCDLGADIALTKSDAGIAVARGNLSGGLALTTSVFPLPGSPRAYQDVAAVVKASGDTLTIDHIRAFESDHDVPGSPAKSSKPAERREVSIAGQVGFSKELRPRRANVELHADRWLLFGTPKLGRVDAPRGTLTLDAKVRAELDRPIKVATVDVDKLEVLIPDRFEKAHQPEDVHDGDLVYLDDGKVALGKLAIPERKAAPPKLTEPVPEADASAGPVEPPVEKGFDLSIHVAKGARIQQSPIDFSPHGDLTVQLRDGQRKVRGKLDVTAGELSLGGKMHALEKGSIVFDEAHPEGFMDLEFARPTPAVALRQISEESAGKAVKIHMFGPLADRKTVLGGAGSPGGLVDLLSMHNAGRERLYTEPDLPETVAVQFPQPQGLLVLSFLSVNLPHLLFLDRVAGWSDPDDDGRGYGRLQHFEAERYFADGSGRIKAIQRPAEPTRSEDEIEVDYLFVNDPRTLFGVGGAAGSRGGGGPGLVFEWSSAD